ncbi:hypothetical protein D8S78_18380 [Natrialba swarupiae]|nr:hypothetical protein [Natrialba swarupiae]
MTVRACPGSGGRVTVDVSGQVSDQRYVSSTIGLPSSADVYVPWGVADAVVYRDPPALLVFERGAQRRYRQPAVIATGPPSSANDSTILGCPKRFRTTLGVCRYERNSGGRRPQDRTPQ